MNRLIHILSLLLLFAPRELLSENEPGQQQESAEVTAIYNPIGKRDPFRPPSSDSLERDLSSLNPLDRWGLDQLTLRAVLRGFGDPKAMFEDPEGQTYIVEQGQVLGREQGRLSRVLTTDVIITERTINYLGQESLYERVISLPKE